MIGLDAVVTGVSIAAFVETVKNPLTKFVSAPPLTEKTVAGHVERMNVTVDRVMESVMKNGTPELVVMMTPMMTQGIHRDGSGPRRMMLAGEIQRRLVEQGIPVGEIAPRTVTSWVTDRDSPRRTFEAAEGSIRQSWNVGKTDARFRLTTIAVAAAGAVAVGITTSRKVTNDDLSRLATLELPTGWTLPTNARHWPAKCGPKTSEEGAA
ncbi:hypothetical protein H7J07_06750 [Mycobacterium koreense]|uniref:hypothetical protein n=1 Tax=Mycolicibacillus koreensis TaxID=1069220 RepID=UPI0010564F29|nr:hypothetical protein [Mycolicibacillus koreensis]MCV7247918.1 hypothetical protein [Mycolicibacillus koreensis]